MKELEANNKLHRIDDLHTQNAQEELDDYASRSWPGYWIFVGPGSKKKNLEF